MYLFMAFLKSSCPKSRVLKEDEKLVKGPEKKSVQGVQKFMAQYGTLRQRDKFSCNCLANFI